MTPAINLLKKNRINFKLHKYDHDPACTNYGQEAALKLGVKQEQVYKTLLVELSSKELAVGIIPVNCSLSLKKMATLFKQKSAIMANKERAQKTTGYLLGGISPLGQKKRLQTVLDETAKSFDTIYVSGGKRGLDVELDPKELLSLLDAHLQDIKA